MFVPTCPLNSIPNDVPYGFSRVEHFEFRSKAFGCYCVAWAVILFLIYTAINYTIYLRVREINDMYV